MQNDRFTPSLGSSVNDSSPLPNFSITQKKGLTTRSIDISAYYKIQIIIYLCPLTVRNLFPEYCTLWLLALKWLAAVTKNPPVACCCDTTLPPDNRFRSNWFSLFNTLFFICNSCTSLRLSSLISFSFLVSDSSCNDRSRLIVSNVLCRSLRRMRHFSAAIRLRRRLSDNTGSSVSRMGLAGFRVVFPLPLVGCWVVLVVRESTLDARSSSLSSSLSVSDATLMQLYDSDGETVIPGFVVDVVVVVLAKALVLSCFRRLLEWLFRRLCIVSPLLSDEVVRAFSVASSDLMVMLGFGKGFCKVAAPNATIRQKVKMEPLCNDLLWHANLLGFAWNNN